MATNWTFNPWSEQQQVSVVQCYCQLCGKSFYVCQFCSLQGAQAILCGQCHSKLLQWALKNFKLELTLNSISKVGEDKSKGD